MARIAKVKFAGGTKLYDYFCYNMLIGEGDIVYVEGKEQPVLVLKSLRMLMMILVKQLRKFLE